MGTTDHSAIASASELHSCKALLTGGSPVGALAPDFSPELAFDDEANRVYVSEGATSADWDGQAENARELFPVGAFPTAGIENNTNDAFMCFDWPNLGAGVFTTTATVSTQRSKGIEASGIGNEVSYWPFVRFDSDAASGETTPPRVDIYIPIPLEFQGWDPSGIRIATNVSGGTDEGYTVRLEALDPTSGAAFGTPKTATRTLAAGSNDGAAYKWLQIDGTTLASGYQAGDTMLLRLTWDKDNFNGGTPNTLECKVSRLECHWHDVS